MPDSTPQAHQQELERLNRLYAALSQINQAIVRVESREKLFQEICRVLVEAGRFKMAWIGWLGEDEPKVTVAAHHGDEAGYLDAIEVYCDDRPEGNGPAGMSIRTGSAVVCNDFANDPETVPWRPAAACRGLASVVAVPIKCCGGVCGALMVYAVEKNFFGEREVGLLEEVSRDIELALEHMNRERWRREAEEALQEREKDLLALLNSTDESVHLSDREGTVLMVNEICARRLGTNPEALMGKCIFDFFPPEVAKTRREFLQAVFDGGEPDRFEDEREGRSFETCFYPIKDSNGNVIRLAVYARDVTERKQAEKAIHASETRYKMILQIAREGFTRVDLQGRLLEVNPTFCRMTGYSQEELLGRRVDFLDASKTPEEIQEHIAKIVQEGQDQFETSNRRKDGTLVDFEISTKFIPGPEGELMSFIRDITQRKRAEESTRRLIVAIDQAVESIVFTDAVGTILYVNQGFEKISGYSREEALGQNPRILKSGKQSEAHYQQMWSTLAQGQVWSGRFVNKRKDGSFYEEEATITPIRNGAGEVESYVAVKRDVTREVLLERQIIEAQKMQAVGQLAGGVAHDYNNILAANMLQLGILLDSPDLTPSLREGLLDLQSGEERGAQLTRQLLMFSRRQVMQKKSVELSALLEMELKMLRRLLGEQIQLEARPGSGPVWVDGDPGMIEQVIMNLCINARDAMPRGGRLSVSIEPVELQPPLSSIEARPGKFACLTVADTGCGMSEETRHQIFEPFFTTKEVGKGTGLGLSTAYGIIKQHNGWIEVSSVMGKGSSFRVYLPLGNERLPATEAADSPRECGGSEQILVVEDNDIVRGTLVSCLRAKGYGVLEASNGLEALARWGSNLDKVDLLVSDMVMPGGITGLELSEAFRTRNPFLPVLIVSGYNQEVIADGIPDQPGMAYLRKPFTAQELTSAVRRLLD